MEKVRGWLIERQYKEGEPWRRISNELHPTYRGAQFSVKVLRNLGSGKLRIVKAEE